MDDFQYSPNQTPVNASHVDSGRRTFGCSRELSSKLKLLGRMLEEVPMDNVIVISEGVYSTVMHGGRLNKEELHQLLTVYCFLDFGSLSNKDLDSMIVLCAGILSFEKGIVGVQDCLAQAFEILLEREWAELATNKMCSLGLWWHPKRKFFNPGFLGMKNYIKLRDGFIGDALELARIRETDDGGSFLSIGVEFVLHSTHTFHRNDPQADPTVMRFAMEGFGLTKAHEQYVKNRRHAAVT